MKCNRATLRGPCVCRCVQMSDREPADRWNVTLAIVFRAVSAAVAVAILVVASSAGAQTPDDSDRKARALYRKGKRAYDQADYPRAVELFREAYETSKDPAFLFNLAQATRLAGDCREAALLYRQFLDEMPTAEHRSVVEKKIGEMKACAAARGTPVDPVEPESKVEVAPPEEVAPPREEPVPERTDLTSAPSRAAGSSAGLWVAAGGGVALVGSAIFWYRAWDADRELDRLIDDGGVFDQDMKDLERRRARDQTIAQIATGVGAAAVAGGLIYHYLVRSRGDERRVPVRASAAGAGGAGAVFLLECDL
jgi:tetratricopeptide (TPR) repeat protein